MFALIVDQVDSRRTRDLVAGALEALRRDRRDDLVLGPDRTAGDEFELLLDDAGVALDVALALLRPGTWSVGIGVGTMELPLPATANAAAGPAMIAAREAVEAAKRAPYRFAVRGGTEDGVLDARGVQALVEPVLELRRRRSSEGWEVADLLRRGDTQTAVAARIGVTSQAVSLRARAAGVRLESAALPAIVALLDSLDRDGTVVGTAH